MNLIIKVIFLQKWEYFRLFDNDCHIFLFIKQRMSFKEKCETSQELMSNAITWSVQTWKKTYMLPIDAIFPQNSAKLFRHYQNHTKFAHISGNNLSRPFFSLFNLDLWTTLHDLRFKSIKFFHQPYVQKSETAKKDLTFPISHLLSYSYSFQWLIRIGRFMASRN